MQQDNSQKDKNAITLATLAAVTAVDVACARGLNNEKGGRNTAIADYSDRSGFPRGVEAAWGAVRNRPRPLANNTKAPAIS
jgi:hypothetical protein